MKGPTPKAPDLLQRRNVAPTRASLREGGRRKVPPLPVRYSHAGTACLLYHPETIAWWRAIWRSPMAAQWIKSDLPQLVMLAQLVDRFHHEPSAALAAEIRQQRTSFGLTPIDRRRLQWTIEPDAQRTTRATAPPTRAADDDGDDPRRLLTAVK